MSMQGPIHLSLVIECLCTCQDPREARHISWHAHTMDPIMWTLRWTVDVCTVDKPNPTPIGVTLNCVGHCSAEIPDALWTHPQEEAPDKATGITPKTEWTGLLWPQSPHRTGTS